MSTLHIYFSLRNQKAFQRVLDASRTQPSSKPGTSTSGGKSWTRRSPLTAGTRLFTTVDVNARDSSGRSVLHLAASATDASASEYVRMLLAHPNINVNLADTENHWTALHRALYSGNITIAVLLVQRPDIDISLKDFEGYTAFDLYNSTVEGTRPVIDESKGPGKLRVVGDLFTWGANRNATLGVGDGDDRAFPEQINVESAQAASRTESSPVEDRFAPTRVRDIVMSKLHTGVVTDENRSNLYVCGFGSGGRLGPGQHTQYSLVPVPQLSHAIVSVALGQDHTLALTNAGEVLSWGLNRFAQLGYVVETPSGLLSRIEEPIQATPRKVAAPGLKGKTVRGVAACKTASACWTATEVFSWGTNSGQLGYDKTAHPVQTLPRVVTKISQPVISVTITDTAMACLLETNDVVCIYNDNHFRVNFPAHAFPSEMKTYRPPQAIRNASIDKITSCDTLIAALSTNGELFTFNLPAVSESGSGTPSAGKARDLVKPQRVWALRKKFSSVKDVALGADGSIIICTESGHVFVRPRTAGKAFKFQRMPFMQRVVKVAANNTGAYAALRVDAVPTPIAIKGKLLPEDIVSILPYGAKPQSHSQPASSHSQPAPSHSKPAPSHDKRLPEYIETLLDTGPAKEMAEDFDDGCSDITSVAGRTKNIPTPEFLELEEPEEDEETVRVEEQEEQAIIEDQRELARLCELLEKHKDALQDTVFNDDDILGDHGQVPHGADLIIHVQNSSQPRIPAHRVILAARSAVLADALAGGPTVDHAGVRITLSRPLRTSERHSSPQAPWKDPMVLKVVGCHPLTVFILLDYLYSDRLLALWDWRVAEEVAIHFTSLKINPSQVKEELQGLAKTLDLPALTDALLGTFKRDVHKTMSVHFLHLQDFCTTATSFVCKDGLTPDVLLCLEDRNVPCHSAILRARSPLFSAFFDDDDWTKTRWEHDGTIHVQFTHLKWRHMQYVMKFIYGGDMEIFDVLDFVSSVDELVDFMLGVMSAANELLLDRLVLICSSIILRQANLSNVCALLAEATHYHVVPLVRSLQGYMAQNMETLLESKMFDDLPLSLVKTLSTNVRQAQAKKSHVTRSGTIVQAAMEKNADWLALQDIPQPIVPSMRSAVPRDGTRLSPPIQTRAPRSPEVSPLIRAQLSERSSLRDKYVAAEGEVFIMDGLEAVPPLSLGQEQTKPYVADLAPKPSGWKVPSTTAPRMDMKAIMAEAETKKAASVRPVPPTATPVSNSPSEATNWRAPSRHIKPSISDSLKTPGSSPWKAVPSTRTPLSHTPAQTPPMTPLMKPTRASEEVSRIQGSPSASSTIVRSQPPTPQRPGMGLVFTPSRQPAAKSSTLSPSIRRSSSSAWVTPPVQPVVQPSSSTSVVSFAEIQKAQQEQLTPKKDKRSLKEIQEEERARQVEDDFLRWWAAEEERLRLEQEVPVETKKQPRSKSKRKKPAAATGGSQPVDKEVQATTNTSRSSAQEAAGEGPSNPQRKRPNKPKDKQTRQNSNSNAKSNTNAKTDPP